MKKSCLILNFILILLTNSINSQNVWNWGFQVPYNNHFYSNEISLIDQNKNAYIIYDYIDTLNLVDTIFVHCSILSQYPPYNKAIVKLDQNGNFDKALDFYVPGTDFSIVPVETKDITVDNQGNLYVLLDPSLEVMVNDVLFTLDTTAFLHILKFNSDFELLWSKPFAMNIGAFNYGCFINSYGNLILSTSFKNDDLLNNNSSGFSIMVIDTSANILSRQELYANKESMNNVRFRRGEDGNFYLFGRVQDSIFIETDTILPDLESEYLKNFYLKFSETGDYLSGKVLTRDVYFYNIQANSEGDFYFNVSSVYDFTIGNDSIFIGNDSIITLIGKLDSLYNLKWYKSIKYPYDVSHSSRFNFDLKNDSLFFVLTTLGNTNFENHNLYHGDTLKVYYGVFSYDGDLVEFEILPGDSYLSSYSYILFRNNSIIVDDCNDVYISGKFNGNLFLETDTLTQPNMELVDGFILNLTRNNNLSLITANNTIISLNSSITLSVPNTFDSIYWSNGGSSNLIEINGSELGIGIHEISVSVLDNGCWFYDSVLIEVYDNSGVSETEIKLLDFSPNPVINKLKINIPHESKVDVIRIYNLEGKIILEGNNNLSEIELTNLDSGIYIIEVLSKNTLFRNKFIKQ